MTGWCVLQNAVQGVHSSGLHQTIMNDLGTSNHGVMSNIPGRLRYYFTLEMMSNSLIIF